MSYPNDAPAAAWYPDPQTPGQVRWWDGMNWTEHVSKPAAAHAVQTLAEQLAAEPAVTEVEQPLATVTYIGRHAAGATPAPRRPSTAPRIRPREREELFAEALVEARVEALSYA
jgi:hypothetical protein